MSPARFRWGILLILVGLIMFFENIDLLDVNFLSYLAVLIPIFLISVGIEKIFAKTQFKIVSYLSSVAILGAGLLFAFSGYIGGRDSDYFSESEVRHWYDENVKHIVAEVDVDETALTIRDSGEDIIYARFDRFTTKPDFNYELIGDTALIKVIGSSNDLVGGIVKIETDKQQDWMVSFSKDIPLDFVCRGDKADVHLNLATTPLENLKLDMKDSYIYLKLGDLMPNVHVSINGQDSNLKLRIPEHVGVKINAAGFESYFERVGMQRSNGWFVSGGIDTLKSKVEIDMDAKLSSFSIDYF